MTTKEMIEVMQAFARGEQIEYRDKGAECWFPLSFDPDWNWEKFDYRVKLQPAYRPYKNADEFLKAQKEHGMYLHHDDFPNWYQLPLFVTDKAVTLSDTLSEVHDDSRFYEREITLLRLFREFKWQDGTPCGVKEE
jgi:hypothetical protein